MLPLEYDLKGIQDLLVPPSERLDPKLFEHNELTRASKKRAKIVNFNFSFDIY
jgi:hypothetical protein